MPNTRRYPPERILVVGGGLAASRSCEALRYAGYQGELLLVSDEAHLPYDRPPLSKAVLRGSSTETTLATDFAALGVRVELGTEATGLRLDDQVVVTNLGERPYDALVIATGASPIRLPGTGEQLTLRTIDESLQIRGRLLPGKRLVIIGASWIGAEVATAALEADCLVTCVEAATAPSIEVLGPEVTEHLQPWWSEVDLRLGTSVERIDPGRVTLQGGEALTADTIITGVGVSANTKWLEGSGLALDRGILVDEQLRAAPNVVAVGDVAARWSPRWGSRLRFAHWNEAATAPEVAAATLLAHTATGDPYDPVPYFWSDQFGHKLQYLGHHQEVDSCVVQGSKDSKGWTASWYADNGLLSAFLAVDCPRELGAARRTFEGQAERAPSCAS